MNPWLLLSWTTVALASPPEGDAATRHFRQVSLGDDHGCGITQDGTVACWGDNARGQLGHGTTDPTPVPQPVPDLTDVAALSTGHLHTCALTRMGRVWCWGDDQAGQAGGNGDLMITPVEVQGLPAVRAIAAGATHTCALSMEGTVSCWGNNLYGQLGVDSLRNARFPVPVPGVEDATSIAVGYGHSCAALASGGAICWGDPTEGQLGRKLADDAGIQPPTMVEAELPVLRALAARDNRTCALHAEGVTCWGGSAIEEGTFHEVLPRTGLVALSLGTQHGCALAGGGHVSCWGENDQGQLGIRAKRRTSVAAYGVHDAISLSAGRDETCVARREGPAVCWGRLDAAAHEASYRELPPIDPGRKRERQLPPNIDLAVRMTEFLGPDGGRIRVTLSTIAAQPCANTTLDTEVEVDKRRVRLKLGDPKLPDGDCIAVPAPAVVTYDFPADIKGRRDLIIRKDRKEDFYQLYISPQKVEALPLQDTFTAWDGPPLIWRIPEGSMAVSCTDRTDAPLCAHRASDGLPTCRELYARPELTEVPQLKDRDYENAWFQADPTAKYISPDVDLQAYPQLFQDVFADGSECMQVVVRTWRGETWSNQPR
jgi:alpha-tubulin suppressor-like RCC1 family protein